MRDTLLAARGLYARVREQHALSEALHVRTREALAHSRAAQAAVHVHEVCSSPRPLAAGDFRLRGTVEGLPVGAVWAGAGSGPPPPCSPGPGWWSRSATSWATAARPR